MQGSTQVKRAINDQNIRLYASHALSEFVVLGAGRNCDLMTDVALVMAMPWMALQHARL